MVTAAAPASPLNKTDDGGENKEYEDNRGNKMDLGTKCSSNSNSSSSSSHGGGKQQQQQGVQVQQQQKAPSEDKYKEVYWIIFLAGNIALVYA